MNIIEVEARAIVEMANVCFGEGQGSGEASALLRRISQAFPDVVPAYLLAYLLDGEQSGE